MNATPVPVGALGDMLIEAAFFCVDQGFFKQAGQVAVVAASLCPAGDRLVFLRHYLEMRDPAAPPWDIDTLVETGKQLRGKHLRLASEQAFRKARDMHTHLPWAHVHLGVELRDRGALDDAMACFVVALGLEPDHIGALTEAAATCRVLGDFPGEERYLRAALRDHPRVSDLRYALGSLLRQQRRFGEAREVLQAPHDRVNAEMVVIEAALLEWQSEGCPDQLAALCQADEISIDVTGAFLNRAFRHRRIAADILIGENSAWVDAAGAHDQLLLAPEAARAVIMRAVADRAPFSFIRLGDGEGALLSYVDTLRGTPSPQHRLHGLMLGSEIWRTWLGKAIRDESGSRLVALAERLQDAVDNAGLVGIPKVSDTRGAISYIEYHGCARSHAFVLGRRTAGLVVSQMSVLLHGLGLYDEIVSRLSQLSLVTCHPGLGAAIEARFPGVAVRSYFIPLQSGHRHLISHPWNGPDHFPDIYDALCRDIEVPDAGHVFFVAAGVFGKIYCDVIRQRGGIGLDIGAMADAFAGFNTRASISEQFPELMMRQD